MPSIILSILQIDLHCSGWICSQKTFRKYFWDIFVWDKIRDKKHINVLIERSLLVQEGPLKFFGLELQQWLHYGILAYTYFDWISVLCLLWSLILYKVLDPFNLFINQYDIKHRFGKLVKTLLYFKSNGHTLSSSYIYVNFWKKKKSCYMTLLRPQMSLDSRHCQEDMKNLKKE